ncbi:MAG: BatA domain-containing protein [Planctomycetota bacterium]|nr:BatA domain-containing protein [Planctomycetota bacterium]
MSFITTYWAAWLVAGAVAATIPVVIHMIHLARAPEVPFPTLRFLKSAAEKTARRRRIENILLMILRMLLFGLLAFALSRPFLQRQFSLFDEQKNSAAVVILDNSYSMNVRHEQATRFSKAKEEARAILDSKWRPAQAAVLLTNPGAAPVPTQLLADRAKLFSQIADAQISSGKADIVGSVKAAYALLDKAQAAEKRLWILTDRQALSWQGLQNLEEPHKHPDLPVAIIRPTEPSFTNVAVASAEVVSRSRVVGMPIRIDALVRNCGPAPEKRNVLLFVDDLGQPRKKQAVDLTAAGSPSSSQMVSLTHAFEKPGPHRVLVAIEGSDSIDVDNTRRIPLVIADRIPVLVVKQRAADIKFQDPSFYLVRALDPVGSASEFPWAIKPVEITADLFDPAALDQYDVVFLNNVAAVRTEAARALADYVARGRTLVVFCGAEVNPRVYNALFMDQISRQGGLLPAKLKERVGDAVLKTTVEKITQVQGQSPYLEDLVESADIYQDVLVYEYFRTEAAQADAVLARLSNGDPFLLAKPFGEGRVLLFTTAATTDWSTFPIRNLILPLKKRVVHQATSGQNQLQNLQAGQTFESNLNPDLKEVATAEVSGPLGPAGETVSEQRETQLVGGRNVLRFDKTWNLGYYTWRVPLKNVPGGIFSTNPDGAESDLAEIVDDKLRTDFAAKETHVAASLKELEKRFEDTARRELWQYVLLACLLLTVCEPLIANWMRPDRTRDTAHPTLVKKRAA